MKGGARGWDDSGEARHDAEGEPETFFYDRSLLDISDEVS